MIHRRALFGTISLLIVLAGAVSGCGPNAPPVAETPPPPVTVSQPLLSDVVEQDEYEGRIGAAESAEIRARVRGHIVKIAFEAGQIVKKGDLLYEIDPKPYQATLDSAKAQEKSAQASLELSKTEYERARSLFAKNAASLNEVQVRQAKLAVDTASLQKAQAAIEQAQLDLDYTKVTAPFAGKISRTQVDVGNLVNAGGGETLLTTLVSVDPMYVYFDVDERSLLRYRKRAKSDEPQPPLKDLHIPVYVALEGEQGYPHKGEIDFADNRVNPSTGTIQVRGVLPNAKRLLDAGMRARIRIPVSDPRKSLLITERAVGTDQGRKFVYVVNDQNVAERRDVTLGRVSDGLQVVQAGVKPEDWIIVNGIQRVRDGAKVDPKRVTMPGAPAEPTNQGSKN